MKNKIFSTKQIVTALSLMVFVACTGDKKESIPDTVYTPDSMVSILADVHIAEAQLTQIGYRPNITEFRSSYVQDMLLKNNIDTTRFNTSFEFYSQKPALFANMYDQVLIQIRQKQAEKIVNSQ